MTRPVDDLACLIEEAQSGDALAETRALEALYPLVHKHLSFVLVGSPLLDDAVQESMVAIFRSLGSFRYRVSARAWALKIATRTARRYVAAQSKHVNALTPLGTVPEQPSTTNLEARNELQQLERFLLELAPKKREAFILLEILQLTAKEGGEALGVFANTAASRARHARSEIEAKFARAERSHLVPVEGGAA